MGVPFYITLVHYPIQNRQGSTVTTAVTNLDIHDIARTARTYGARGYFIVTPIEDQQRLVNRILDHWKSEQSQRYHPDRFEALKQVRLVSDFEAVKKTIRDETGEDPEVVLTDARLLSDAISDGPISYQKYRSQLETPGRTRPVLITLGTGWGLAPEFYGEAHRILKPIYGPEGEGGYNHLSVRAAAATILDRLFGK